MKLPLHASLVAILALAGVARAQTVADFSDIALPPESFDNNADGGAFVSRGAAFNNAFTDFGGGFTAYDGFALSTVTDTATPGFGNQYASYAGGGAGGQSGAGVAGVAGDTFAVGFSDASAITLPAGQSAASVRLTNTTYAALSMLQGDSFAKKFGGPTGDDPDFFSVTLTGTDAPDGGGAETGAVTVFLADYRFADNSLDYVVNDWQKVDLTPLGAARSIGLSFASSDVGQFGINTPTYVAVDDLTLVPEPGSLALLAAAGLLLGRGRRGTGF